MLSAACGCGGAGDSRRSSNWVSRSTSDWISPVSSRESASPTRRDSNCAAPFSPANGLRNSCASPLSAADRAEGSAATGSSPGNSSTGCASSSHPPVSRAVSQISAKRGAPPGKAIGRRRRRTWSCGTARPIQRASASPSNSSAASGSPGRRRALTPSQRAKATLVASTRPPGSARASGVLNRS